MPLPKNMWLASAAWAEASFEPKLRPPIFLSAPARPAGLRVNWTDGGVGEELALPADGGLDEAAEQDANPADEQQGQAEQGERVLPAAGAQQYPADDRQAEDAEDDAHQAQVEAHVAVEDVAELVADDALQLVAGEQLHGAARSRRRRRRWWSGRRRRR